MEVSAASDWRAGVRKLPGKLTRRRGDAENVREGLKITLCSLWLKNSLAADTAAIQRVKGAFHVLKIFGSFRIVLTASRQVVARGRATSGGGFRLRRFGMHASNFWFAFGELRNSVR